MDWFGSGSGERCGGGVREGRKRERERQRRRRARSTACCDPSVCSNRDYERKNKKNPFFRFSKAPNHPAHSPTVVRILKSGTMSGDMAMGLFSFLRDGRIETTSFFSFLFAQPRKSGCRLLADRKKKEEADDDGIKSPFSMLLLASTRVALVLSFPCNDRLSARVPGFGEEMCDRRWGRVSN